MEIIGLSGYARTGKDEAAKVLVEEFGFTRVAFADKLRDVLYALNPIVEISMWAKADVDFIVDMPTDTHPHVQHVIDFYGWGGYKETVFGPEIRRLLQRLGTEAGRDTIGENVWVDAAFNTNANKIVVTDCRFPNEAEAIKDRGGEIWRIDRTGVGPINNHPSETSLDNWMTDELIGNYSDLETFKKYVRQTYARRF